MPIPSAINTDNPLAPYTTGGIAIGANGEGSYDAAYQASLAAHYATSVSPLARFKRLMDPARVKYQTVSSSPPTITVDANNALPSFANRLFIPLTDPRIGVLNANLLTATGSTGALNDGVQRAYYVGATTAINSASVAIEIVSDAPTIAVMLTGQAYVTNVIDGNLASAANSASNASTRLVEFAYGSRQPRRHKFIVNSAGCCGIWVDVQSYVFPSIDTRRPKLATMGDSYSQATGVVFGSQGLGYEIGELLGCQSTFVDPVGGTGFSQQLPANTGNNNALQRLGVTTTSAVNPSIHLTMLGINDPNDITLTSNANAYFAQLRAWWPPTILGACGPWCPDGTQASLTTTPSSGYPPKRDKIAAALATVAGPWVFVDPLTDSWVNSSGASSSGSGEPWSTGNGYNVVFTAALSAATSGTLTVAFTGTTGAHNVIFSDGTLKSVTFANGSTSVSWTGAVTAAAIAYYTGSTSGNSSFYIQNDTTHPVPAGVDYLAYRVATRIREAILAL